MMPLRPRSSTLRLLPVASIFLGLAFSAAPLRAQSTQQYDVPGDDVVIYNLVGEVRIVAGTGTNIQVEISRGGEDSDQLRVETGAVGKRESLRVIYPGNRFVYRPLGPGSSSSLTVQDDGTFGSGKDFLSGHRVKISGSGSGLDARADLTIRVPAGKTLSVHQAVGDVSASNVTGSLTIDTSAAPVSVDGLKGSLKVDVGSGEVSVKNTEADLVVDTGSGDVNLSDIKSPELYVDTGSGTVTGSTLDSKSVKIDTGSGDIRIGRMSGEVASLDTGSGSVSVELTGDIESLSIETGSGDVDVSVPPTLGAELHVETGSGDIEVNVPHESYRDRRSYFTGKIGDGKGRLRVETGSGDVLFARSKPE